MKQDLTEIVNVYDIYMTYQNKKWLYYSTNHWKYLNILTTSKTRNSFPVFIYFLTNIYEEYSLYIDNYFALVTASKILAS